MYYPEEIVEEIRSKNDIVDVISTYVHIQKKGSSYFGLCPFHNEKSPSFSVSGTKQMYYCFGCGAGGNVLTFLMEYENYTFPEALKFLADRAGVSLPEEEYSEEARAKESKRTKLLAANKEAAKYFYYCLRSPKGALGLEYLQKRELTEETMKKFGLGYANITSNDLVQYLKSKGFDDETIKDAGLADYSEKYGFHDKFWNRVMFPIYDANNRVIAFGGRVMGEGEPKYLNSPETLIFDKSRNLFGLNFARSSRKNHFILCEGYMDVISMHQAGFTETMASLGTAFTSGQASILKRFGKDIILAYDSDGAGTKAALRAIGILKEVGLNAKVLSLEPYKDPDEFIKAMGAAALEERIEQAENSFFFEIRILQKSYDMKDPQSKTEFHRAIAKKLCDFTEEVERDNYLQAVAEKYFIGLENLRKLVIGYAARTGMVAPIDRPKSGIAKKSDPEENRKKPQRLFLTYLSEDKNLYHLVKKYISAEDFTDPLYRQVAQIYFQQVEEGNTNPAAIVTMFTDEEEQRQVAALFNTTLPEINEISEQEKAIKDIVLAIKRDSFRYYSEQLGSDASALQKVVDGKKALQELQKIHFTINHNISEEG